MNPSWNDFLTPQLQYDLPGAAIPYWIVQSVLYNIIIFSFSSYMSNKKERLNTRAISKVHNILMALFSLFLAIACIIVCFRDGRFSSFSAFHCNPYRSDAWMVIEYLFLLSKVWEMFDTVLLVANKKKVIWLHLIHHSSTYPLTGALFYGSVGFDFLPVFLNLFVHALMYSYYASPKTFSALRIHMTTMQIVQFLIVLAFCILHWVQFLTSGHLCSSPFPLLFTSFWYIVYLALFLNFFAQQYINKKNAKNYPPMTPRTQLHTGTVKEE